MAFRSSRTYLTCLCVYVMLQAKSKNGKKKKTSTVIHGVVTSEMTKEEIEEYVVLLRAELERERAERNKTALERDKVTTFWETCRQQVEDARGLLRKKERELEDAEERHQMEMRVYRQKVKHLLFEENARQVDARHDTTVTLNTKAEETRVEVRELLNENYTLKAQMRLRQLESEEAVKMLKKQHETEVRLLDLLLLLLRLHPLHKSLTMISLLLKSTNRCIVKVGLCEFKSKDPILYVFVRCVVDDCPASGLHSPS